MEERTDGIGKVRGSLAPTCTECNRGSGFEGNPLKSTNHLLKYNMIS